MFHDNIKSIFYLPFNLLFPGSLTLRPVPKKILPVIKISLINSNKAGRNGWRNKFNMNFVVKPCVFLYN